MKIPVDEVEIIVGLGGLVLFKHARGAAREQLVTARTAEAIWREIKQESRPEGRSSISGLITGERKTERDSSLRSE
jgi:hypothetical protein